MGWTHAPEKPKPGNTAGGNIAGGSGVETTAAETAADIESLISINNQLQLPEAAEGTLAFAADLGVELQARIDRFYIGHVFYSTTGEELYILCRIYVLVLPFAADLGVELEARIDRFYALYMFWCCRLRPIWGWSYRRGFIYSMYDIYYMYDIHSSVAAGLSSG